MKKHLFTLLPISVLFFLNACNSDNINWQNIEKDLQTQLIMAEDGDTIRIPEGHFKFSGSISLDEKNNIVIIGAGLDKTVLSFKGQTEGAEGLRITNGSNILVKDLTIQDSKGDAIKTQDIVGMSFVNVRTEWTGKPKESNGAYGFYPVLCTNVLIDGCIANGASDAGIYVGQSKYVVVKNCTAYHNVAGIEIENTLYADVYDNYAHDNTGGILVFDMPNLKQKKGGYVRVYNNLITNNNHRNFAPEGNIVGKVPAGTGFMVLAASNVEVFNNRIEKNKTAGVSIASFLLVEPNIKDTLFDPYPKAIEIHDNTFKRKLIQIADWRNDLGKLALFKFMLSVPDVLYDGIVDPVNGSNTENKICLKNNGDITFANIDAQNNFKNIATDINAHNCDLEQLPQVQFQTITKDTLSILTDTEIVM